MAELMEKVLAEFLALWRRTRDPEVGDVIDAVSARMGREPIAGGPRHQRCKQWDEIAAAADPADVPRLLGAFAELSRRHIEPRLEVVGRWPADPRIASGLIALIERLPQGGEGLPAEPFWDQVLIEISLSADSRHRAELERVAARLPAMTSGSIAHYLPRRLRAAARGIGDSAPLTADERQQCADWLGRLHTAPSAEQRQMIDAMFARVHADPDDDDARQVLADALLEAGDARGEFIALQLALAHGMASPGAARRRQRQLLDRHGRQWLGALEPAVQRTGVRYERGFVAAVRVSARDRSTATCAEWSTVSELDLRHWPGPPIDLLVTAPLRALRKLTLHQVTPDHLRALADLTLPRLTELDVSDASFAHGQAREEDRRPPMFPSHHRVLWRPGAIGHQLSLLAVDSRGFIDHWIQELARGECPLPGLLINERWQAGWSLRVTRDPARARPIGHFFAGGFVVPDTPAALLEPIIAGAPMNYFEAIEIEVPPERAEAVDRWRPVRQLLDGWPDVAVIRAPWLA